MREGTYGVALSIKANEPYAGLSPSEASDLILMLHGLYGIPVTIRGKDYTAMGFVNYTDSEFMNFDHRILEGYVLNIFNSASSISQVRGQYKMDYPDVGEVSILIL